MMQIVILAGGKGTRLASVSGDLPKPLVDVCGVPLLGRQLQMAARQGFHDVLVLTGHGAEQIADYCGDGSAFGLNVRCLKEESPCGTAGAVTAALPLLGERFIVMYGDTVMDVDLVRLAEHHQPGVAATLFLHPNDHPYDSDLVDVSRDGAIRGFYPSPHPANLSLANLVNAALYVVERDALAAVDALPPRPDFCRDVFPRMLELGMTLRGYESPEYIKDAGTPDRIEKVRRDILSGKVASRSLASPGAAIFLDRDGVINEERGRITRPEDICLIKGSARAIGRINDSNYRAVIVSNQPVIARGDCTEEDLAAIHRRLSWLLGQERVYVDALYYCPHHPHGGYAGEVPALKIVCDCRKPSPGLTQRAAVDLNIDFSRSWMIGDRTGDIQLARNTGMRSILVRTGYGGNDGLYTAEPDFVAGDLEAAVNLIMTS